MSDLPQIKKSLRRMANREKASILTKFFKTGPGEYGYGDVFLGITVPLIRKQVQRFRDLKINDAIRLLKSPVHEERLLALLILESQFQRGDDRIRAQILRQYLQHTRFINNWDLVDLSAPKIIGGSLTVSNRKLLTRLARSPLLWERRMAIVATFPLIRKGEFKDTLKVANILLQDTEDLIRKAAGWMLREVGKKDTKALTAFLKKHYREMPRTMLRYAIEKFPENLRQDYLQGRI